MRVRPSRLYSLGLGVQRLTSNHWPKSSTVQEGDCWAAISHQICGYTVIPSYTSTGSWHLPTLSNFCPEAQGSNKCSSKGLPAFDSHALSCFQLRLSNPNEIQTWYVARSAYNARRQRRLNPNMQISCGSHRTCILIIWANFIKSSS